MTPATGAYLPPEVHAQDDRALLYWLANEHPDLFLRLQAMGDRTPFGRRTTPNASDDSGVLS